MKSKRHAAILELIANREITTQEELMAQLKAQYGTEVTQATISRDIKELRLIKTLSAEGIYRYSEAPRRGDDMLSKFTGILSQSVLSVDMAQGIVVLQCHSGMADAACASLDGMSFPGIVGTIAGDDTIFALCRSREQAEELMAMVQQMIGSKQ